MQVIVLATSVQSPLQVKSLVPVLNELAGQGNWNFALDDIDRVLRIVSDTVKPTDAVKLLRSWGIECNELE
ncbi:MAG: hypothetical protein KF725_10470 [Cyclobacteriaceae bacterium]|nr:hypothetical protein [Cyclobacteriaceae bacterium]UYN86134.1 MAG: hypothetical protein KIT51_14865 [Cyclobacteriaceae bacterium]